MQKLPRRPVQASHSVSVINYASTYMYMVGFYLTTSYGGKSEMGPKMCNFRDWHTN